MRKRFAATAIAVLASLALLIPAGSAQAASRQAPFCGSINPGGGTVGMTLRPGQACTFVPTAVSHIWSKWMVTSGGSNGFGVCTGVVQYPPGWPNGQPLSPTGSGPGNYWQCIDPQIGGHHWAANNPFGAVYGQAVLLNASNKTIVTQPSASSASTFGRIWYFS